MENLLEPDTFYYHPLTRKPCPARRLIQWPDGEITELENNFTLEFRVSLSPEDIVKYYYQSVGIEGHLIKMSKDIGAIKYLIKQVGLDLALFSLDALVNNFVNADDRPSTPPDLVTAYNFVQFGIDQLGRVQQVATQYGVDKNAFNR